MKVWELARQRVDVKFTLSQLRPITAVAFSADDSFIVSASDNGRISIHSLIQNMTVGTMERESNGVSGDQSYR